MRSIHCTDHRRQQEQRSPTGPDISVECCYTSIVISSGWIAAKKDEGLIWAKKIKQPHKQDLRKATYTLRCLDNVV